MPINIEKVVHYDKEGNIKAECSCDCSEKSSLGTKLGGNWTKNKVDIEILEKAFYNYKPSYQNRK